MHKITIYTQATDKPQWFYLRNEFYTEQFANVDAKQCATALASCAGALREILKTNMRICFATFETVNIFGGVDNEAPSFITAFSSYDKSGRRPLLGEMFYRDILRLSLYPKSGRVGHLWLRGCLDSADIETDAEIGRLCRVAPLLLGTLRDAAFAYGCPLFDEMYLLQSNAGMRVSTGETSYYSDSHAQTRWRRRTHGKLVDTANLLYPALEKMASALEVSRYWQGVDVRISPGAVYDDLVAAIGYGEPIHQAIEAASKAGQEEGEENGEQPVLRFGPAWETLIERWQFAKEQGKIPLQELQKKFPTHEESGDTYIDTEFLFHYNELLEKIIARVALTANADWFNPRAYKNQLAQGEARRLPDIIELAF